MITIIKKICKGIIIAIGSIVTVAALVGGSVGIAYRKTVISEYGIIRDTYVFGTLENIKEAVSNSKDLVNSILANGTSELDKITQALEKMKDTDTNNQDITDIEAAVQNIKDLLSKNQTDIENYVNQFSDAVNRVANAIESYAENLTTEKFAKTYDDVTISLTTVSAIILGGIIITAIIELTLYKKVEGVRVRKNNVKSDLVKHMNKILKKYPNLKKDF